MKETKALKLNGISALLTKLLIVISGLILPRLFIGAYGSKYNGLVSTITQYLSLISFLDMGVGAVVQSVLYKPLAEKNWLLVSQIVSSSKNYFNKIAFALVFYIVLLCFYLPKVLTDDIDIYTIISLLFILSISLFAQYYFGIVNQLLISSDQRGYVQEFVQIITIILNTILSILLIQNNASIIIVKLVSSIVFLIRPLFLSYYVKKHYKINSNIKADNDPIPDKWSGMTQHIAYTVQSSTDIIILSMFSNLENISIYNVYFSVVQGVRILIQSITNGIRPFFGQLIASHDHRIVNYFDKVEWLIHNSVVFLFGMTGALITPFVLVYTAGVNDINYIQPIFGILLTTAFAIFCIRLPYQMMILAAGHFRQTQNSSIIEVIINIIVSVMLVAIYGLSGVAVGTLISMLYRTVYLVNYLTRNIIFREIKFFNKIIFVDCLNIICLCILLRILNLQFHDFKEWIINAIILGLLYLLIMILNNHIFYKTNTRLLLKNKLL